MQTNRVTSIGISRGVGMDPDAGEAATAHRMGRDGVASRGPRTPPAGSPSIHYGIINGADQGTLRCKTAHGEGLHPRASVRLRHANNRLCGIRFARIAKSRMCLETQSRL